MKRHLTAHDRLVELFKGSKRLGSLQVRSSDIEELSAMDPNYVSSENDLNWENATIRNTYAGTVLTLKKTRIDRPLEEAFKASGLNPSNPLHWRQLITMFAIAHYEKKKSVGRPSEWTDIRYCNLLQDVDRLRERNPSFSMSAVFENLTKLQAYKNNKGKRLTGARVKTAFREARDPKHNGVLAAYVMQNIQQKRVAHQRKGLEWTSAIEGKITKEMIDLGCEAIATRWRSENSAII